MKKVSTNDKREIAARIACFPTSGLQTKLSGGITRYHGSGIGRDFKALAQMAPFVLWNYLDNKEKMWLYLSNVTVTTSYGELLGSKRITIRQFVFVSQVFTSIL